MTKEDKVIKYYILCNKLKNVIRTGWKMWNIKRERVESVAEHVYGTQMIALAMKSEYQYDIDIMKVIYMLAVHELEEILIGDIPMTSIEHKTKQVQGHEAVKKVLNGLIDSEAIASYVFEFDEQKTKEAIFAYHCDKLECDLQARLYDLERCIDINDQKENHEYNEYINKNGKGSFTDIWFHSDEKLYEGDENFQKVFNSARNILKPNN